VCTRRSPGKCQGARANAFSGPLHTRTRTPSYRKRALRAELSDHPVKPIDLERLLAIVEG